MTYILFYTYELRINSKINLKAWHIKINIIPSAVRLIKSATETKIRNCIMNSMCNMHANLPFHGNYAVDVRPVTPRDCGLQSDFSLEIKLHKKILEGNMTSFAHQKNLCKWGWGGSEIRLAIINCKRRTDFAPTERPRCCGWIFSNYFFGTFRRPNCMARVTQNLKADPSCHNTNVFQIGTRVNVSFTRVIAFFKVKPSRGSNNSSLL